MVVDSYPVNGQEGIELNEVIKVVFNDIVAPINFEDIEVRNLNKSEIVDFDFTHDKNILTVVVKDRNAIGANSLAGSTKYEISIKDVYHPKSSAEKIMAYLSFTTKVESIKDFNTDNIPDNVIINFKMVQTYPANEARNISPKYIKFTYNNDINPYSIHTSDEVDDSGNVIAKQNIYLFKNSPEYIEEILLLSELEYGSRDELSKIDIDCKIIDNELYIIPVSRATGSDGQVTTSILTLDSNAQYTALVKNVVSTEGMQGGQSIITFTTIPSPLYIEPTEITSTPYFNSVTSGTKTIEDIYDMINRYSLDAEDVATEAGTYEAITWRDTADASMSACVKNYVRYKTLYYLVYDRYITVVSASEDKKLSDLEISYANKPNYLKSLLDDLWGKLTGAEEEIKRFGETVEGIGVFIKGENVDTTYTFMDRSFKDYEGNTYWDYTE